MGGAKLPQHFGLEFGNHAVKLAYIEKQGNVRTLKALVAKEVGKIGLLQYLEKQQERIVAIVKEMVEESKVPTKYVALAIPESSIFSQILTIPKVSDEELTEAVYWKLKPLLPRPIDEFSKDYLLVSQDPDTGERKVLVVAAPLSLIDKYQKVLRKAGLVPVAVETEILANMRTVKFNYNVQGGIIMDFGSASTDIGIFLDGNLVFSQSIATGSDLLTKAILSTYNITYAQAEQYKRNYGLDRTKLDGKIYQSLKPVMETLTAEIMRSLEFSRTDLKRDIPQDLYLAGQGSLLPGLKEYLLESLHLNTVQIVNPFAKLTLPPAFEKYKTELHPEFSISIGLSLKED